LKSCEAGHYQVRRTLLETRKGLRVAVTLPGVGALEGGWRWQRSVQPLPVAPGVVATQVSVIVTTEGAIDAPLYRVDWLVAPQRRAAAGER
jgi:hypothetical protein